MENKGTSLGGTSSGSLSLVQRGTNTSHRILVVDDDVFILQLNTEVLVHAGYHVDAAEDGAAAWDTLQVNRYDLLIIDNNMPRLSGVELLKKLRAACMAVPVIMATGRLPKEEFTRYPWLQPTAMLLKPYTIGELLGKVKEVLRATAGACEQTAQLPNMQSRLSAVRLWR